MTSPIFDTSTHYQFDTSDASLAEAAVMLIPDPQNPGHAITPPTPYRSPDGRGVVVQSTMAILFSDDFGGSAIDPTRWTVLDGGLGANPNLGYGTLTQGAIGSGITGMTDAVAASALTVAMNTTPNAERWYLSNQIFAGAEGVTIILSKSQPLTANSIFVGLVEVDPATGVPLLNPNLAADFTNRGGIEFGATVTTTAYACQAVGDSSPVAASGNTGTAAVLTTSQEYTIEFHAEDIIGSSAAVDAATGKLAGVSRVSTQCPNDGKCYKLLLRFRNVGTPASNTSVVIQRVLVVNGQEQRVEIASARGDQNAQKGLFVNTGFVTTAAGQLTILVAGPNAAYGTSVYHKLTSAATTNATSVKTSVGTIAGGSLRNRAATERYFKFYNKASAPTVGTDVPVLTIGLPAGELLGLSDFVGPYGLRLTPGIAYAITANYADTDTTAISAGDVDVNLIYA